MLSESKSRHVNAHKTRTTKFAGTTPRRVRLFSPFQERTRNVIVSNLVWCGVRPLQVDGVAIWEQAAITPKNWAEVRGRTPPPPPPLPR
eukprot:COSAG06_NODE_697_length_12986_cov_4386.721269_3_plen_89_part_00